MKHKKKTITIPGWKCHIEVDDFITLGSALIHRVGMTATHQQLKQSSIGAAAGYGDNNFSRAFYELLERCILLEMMQHKEHKYPLQSINGYIVKYITHEQLFLSNPKKTHYRPSYSNGVAYHTSWRQACKNSALELIERHLILTSWLGMTKPKLISNRLPKILHDFKHKYQYMCYELGRVKTNIMEEAIISVVSLLLPKNPRLPLSIAYGAESSITLASQKSFSEAIQSLAFLWNEEIPTCQPNFSPTPLYHQEFYLYEKNRIFLMNWLSGYLYDLYGENNKRNNGEKIIFFVDLNKKKSTPGFVIKSVCGNTLPLYFGRYNYTQLLLQKCNSICHPIK